MVRTLKRMTRKIRRSKGGGTKRRLRGGAPGAVGEMLNKNITSDHLKDGLKSITNLFAAKPPPTLAEKITSTPRTLANRFVGPPGASTGGSRRRRRRNKTKKH